MGKKESEVTREETVDGVKFVYHWGFCEGSFAFGCIDKNRVIHLTEPEFLVTLARSHELVHHRRWNTPTMRCYVFFAHKSGRKLIATTILLALATSIILSFALWGGGNLPIVILSPFLLPIGLWVLYTLCEDHEEKIAMRETEKMMHMGKGELTENNLLRL